MASDKAASDKAARLIRDGIAANATVSDGKVLVKNQISGNWEPYRGQPLQDPDGNYVDGK